MKPMGHLLFLTILSCQVIFASSQSPQELGLEAVTLLPKSLQSQQAMCERDVEFRDYMLKIQGYLAGQEVTFAPDDNVFQSVRTRLAQPGGRKETETWCSQTIAVMNINIVAAQKNIKILEITRCVDHVERIFECFLKGTKNYFTSRREMRALGITIPSTLPQDFETLNPRSQLSAQSAIDRHASLCEVLKEGYKVILKVDQGRANAFLLNLDPDKFLSKYLRGEITYVMDPDSSSLHDGGALYSQNGRPRGEMTTPLQAQKVTKDRLRRKLAQKQGVVKSASNLPAKVPSQDTLGKGRGPGQKEIALIKEAAALERAKLERKEAEKRSRIEAQAVHARHMKELVRQARLEALRSDSETTLSAPSSALEITSPSKKRVKEKTKGVEDVSKRQRKDEPRALAKSKTRTRPSSGEKEEPREEETQLAANLYKRLGAFWESKAGQTYHDVTQLFRGFGGRVTEKKGGSSHVTLTYYGAGGHKLKHELWRPHGGDNTFGFRTTAALQAFFEKCGLTLH
ncbi:MAG: hypothetical protein C0514_05720 [Candidatus Puniceispirillum sp.]|nr:hypothetical protein [Candidatus Puniceispirillum sp.]